MPTPKKLGPLPALCLALLLTACGGEEVKSTPDPIRFERVAMPVAAEGEAMCADGPCLSDRQIGALLNQAIDALCEANDKIAWLSDYYLKTELGPSCPPAQP